ncbi:hypothetical protein ABIB25_002924 [Nakamurella sp. UYEF19]|uniref:hypothetical protein n=1 Tax=Nakamurella sp. UYEF19 TaxID=1756392 RepID=UPI003393E6BA
MTSPGADDPHDIADTQMFRRFVESGPQGSGSETEARTGLQRLWVWPGLLIPVILSIVIVAVVLVLVL